MEDIEKSCCFTGYRPEKFSFPFETDCPEYRLLYTRMVTGISCMIGKGCNTFYSGMAKGFDILAAEHVALVKKLHPKIRLVAAVPFRGQERGWSADWKDRYNTVLEDCDDVITLYDKYERWAFDRRNRFMVDRSRFVLTYFDGKAGGTANTLKYAAKRGRRILNIYETDPLEDESNRFHSYFRIYPPEDSYL